MANGIDLAPILSQLGYIPVLETGIVDEDAIQWFGSGLTDEHPKIEQNIGIYLNDNLSVLCTHGMSGMRDKAEENTCEDYESTRKIIKSHGYVIMDKPYDMAHGVRK